MNEHKVSINELYKVLRSSLQGLTSREAENRLIQYGPNVLKTRKTTPLFMRFLRQFTNFFALLLIVGSLLAFLAEYFAPGVGNFYIGVALLGVVLLNGVFTFIQQHQSEKIMESFQKMLPHSIEVIRDGEVVRLDIKQIVPGDVILLSEGDKVPADARLIEHNAMKVDHSSLTGESEPQLRKLECTHPNILESRNMIFSGMLVQTGNGRALVYDTGMNTQIGEIIRLTKEVKDVDSPLHKELKHFIRIISTIAIILGVTFFIVSIVLGQQLIGSLIFVIGIIVANVPEGLLPTVTLSLTITAKKMAKRNALVKNLESVETLGSTTVICTDKTGTITENKMSVKTIMVNGKQRDVNEEKFSQNLTLDLLLKNMVLCNNSRLESRVYSGDPTESSLMNFAKKYVLIQDLVKKEPRVHESPFDSKTKRMISFNVSRGHTMAYLKGAPEVVLTKCRYVMSAGKIVSLKEKDGNFILSQYRAMAARGERVLAFAHRVADARLNHEKDFIFVGLVGILDLPRKEIPEAIEKCRTAGIRVIMITGDYSLTAEAIARMVGIVEKKAKAFIVTGERLLRMSDEKLVEILKKKNLIFARTNPIQKLRIVQALQSFGEVVTVTGDGVNDAPALKNADMGVAMGLSGTEVAREASDMVLLDDNFATIVNAIESGRTIFSNIKKFIAYILTGNVPEIMPFIAFALFQAPLALTVVLILSIDLGTDILPAIGLGTEEPEHDVMKEKPRSQKERLLTKRLLFMSYGVVGMIQAAAGFFAFFYVLYHGGWVWGREIGVPDLLYAKALTAFFASIVICQIADVMICRTRKQSLFRVGFFTNKVVMFGIFTELALLSLIVFYPPANKFFGTAPLTLLELSLSIPFALLILFGDELRRFFARRNNQFVERYLTW